MTAPWSLSGLRVLELSTEIAGPYAARLPVDAGAGVIEVEPQSAELGLSAETPAGLRARQAIDEEPACALPGKTP